MSIRIIEIPPLDTANVITDRFTAQIFNPHLHKSIYVRSGSRAFKVSDRPPAKYGNRPNESETP